MEGLNSDCEVGTALVFSSGAKGYDTYEYIRAYSIFLLTCILVYCRALLWRRDDNLVFALVSDGDASAGDSVDCQFSGILQVADEDNGPQTKRRFKIATVPVGDEMVGKVVNFLGYPVKNGVVEHTRIGTSSMYPLLNAPPNMEDRESIDSPLITGVKAIDIITPLGKGQALQVSGIQGSGKTQVCLQAIMGQKDNNVRCVYVAVGCSKEQISQTIKMLEESGCMEYTTVVVATEDQGLGKQYAAICYGCSIAERHRDEGGDALVVFNNIGPMVNLWDSITQSMASLELDKAGDADPSDLVEYEGMLISVAAAQRRQFFSFLIQRCARMHKRLKGGSMTGLFVVPGSPAQGKSPRIKDKIAAYKHLTAAQKAKLLSALQQQEGLMNNDTDSPYDLSTEVVEEFMSMADGQLVLQNVRDSVTGGPRVDPRLSVSRIGSRAYAPAIADLASLVRFELAQANDAQRFAANAATDPMARKALQRADAVTAALPQQEGTICPLEYQIIQLMAVQQGLVDNVPVEQVSLILESITKEVVSLCPKAVEEIRVSKKLSQEAKAAIFAAITTR